MRLVAHLHRCQSLVSGVVTGMQRNTRGVGYQRIQPFLLLRKHALVDKLRVLRRPCGPIAHRKGDGFGPPRPGNGCGATLGGRCNGFSWSRGHRRHGHHGSAQRFQIPLHHVVGVSTAHGADCTCTAARHAAAFVEFGVVRRHGLIDLMIDRIESANYVLQHASQTASETRVADCNFARQ